MGRPALNTFISQASKSIRIFICYNEILPAGIGKLHEARQREVIYLYKDESMKYRKVLAPCNKCQGSGYLPEYYYRDNGVCYDCGGIGIQLDGAIVWEKVNEAGS